MFKKGRRFFSLHFAFFLFLAAESVLADELSWIDALQVADGPTKVRLKTCVASAAAHLAAIRSASFDFEGISEDVRPSPPGSSKIDIRRRVYRGVAKWLRGNVHYEVTFSPGQKDESKLSVLRTDKMLTYTQTHEFYKSFLIVNFPPVSQEIWERNRSLLSSVDPQLQFGGGLGMGGSTLRTLSERLGRLESDESGGLIHITLYLKDSRHRADFYCDPQIDYLLVKARGGEMDGREYKVIQEKVWDWQSVGGVRFPLRFQQITYSGSNKAPVADYDVHIANLHINENNYISESDLTLDALDVPDGTAGVDRRISPIKSLIRVRGKVRELRPGEQATLSPALKLRFEQEQEADSRAQAVVTQRWRWTVATWLCVIAVGVIILFLGGRFWTRMRARTT